MREFSAIVLAGGAARRMGGALKPSLAVGGIPMLARVLDAIAEARPRIVVGSLELVSLVPHGVSLTMEVPPGGGPVAAIAAGLTLLTESRPHYVAVVAGDLPFLSRAAMTHLRDAARQSEVDGAVLIDDTGQPQWLAGVWRVPALLTAMPTEPVGHSMRSVVDGLRVARVTPPAGAPPAWLDCDTEEDVRRAEEWIDVG